MESISNCTFLIAAAGLVTATLGFVAARQSHTAPPKVVAVGVQELQAELDDVNTRITHVAPTDDAQLQDQIRIARARHAEIDEVRLRIAARHE